MKVGITVRGDLRELMQTDLRAAEIAVTRAVAAAGLETQGAARAMTAPALGRGVANAWRLAVYPRNQPSLGAAALVGSRAPLIVDAFSRGATIRPRLGGETSLAIPLPAAGRGRGGKRITPAEFEARTGLRLRVVQRSSRVALLVARNARVNSRGVAAGNTSTRRGATFTRVAGRADVPVFILLKQVTLPKLLDLDTLARRADARFSAYLTAELDKVFR